jgi:antitoxin (DNA-binding transcriptional repressor) of toxin-antitoxin stability system
MPWTRSLRDPIIHQVKTATVRDLRYNFPQVEAWLSSGEEIELTKRGRIIGRIVPAPAKEQKLKMPDFAARANALCGGRKIDTASLLRYNKGRY